MNRTNATLLIFVLLALGLLVGGWGAAGALALADTPIYNIQYTTDPGAGTYPSPLVNQVVDAVGVVYAVYPGRGFSIADAAGPWHGIYVYYPSGTMPGVGDQVRVTGTVREYYGLTELGNYATYTVLSTGNPIYAPSVITAMAITYNSSAISEQYESVFVEVHDITVTAEADTYYIWTFTDASSGFGKADDWGYRLTPAVDDRYSVLRGTLIYDYDEFKVMPRSASDATLMDSTPPTVTVTIPDNGAIDVSPHKPIHATFDEALNATTVNTTTFSLDGPGSSVAGVVTYDGAQYQATFTPDAALAASSLHTATLTTGIQDVAGNALAATYTWTFTTGALDVTPPTVADRSPAPDATGVAVNASVVVTFSEELDPDTVIAANFDLVSAYGSVPATLSYDSNTWTVTLDPTSNLLPTSRYTATVKAAVADWAGLTLGADVVWSFETAVEPPMNAYHGDIHNHTSYSDGSGTPASAFATGRAAGYDFMAVTDHSHSVSDAEWADILSAANAATVDDQFVALRGFEYTQGAEGHINVYNTTRHAVRTQQPGCTTCDYTPNLEQGVTVEGFYHWQAVTGTQALDAAGTVIQFNHPGWINFNDWVYHPEISATARLEEIGNGYGASYGFSEEEYIRSLDYGWHVGATNNADTHSNDWGTNTDHRTGVWMAGLTKSDLLDAFRARRTFATEDKNYTLRMKANGVWMGSEIANTGQITFDIYGSDPDSEVTTLVQLITGQGQVVAQTAPGTADFTWQPVLVITPGVHYYYVKAVQADGDRMVSSPVWTQGADDISISDLTVQPTIPTIYNPSLFTARVTNRGQTTLSVTVTFKVDTTTIGTVPVTVDACAVGPCADAYAYVSWQPMATGPVSVTATLTGAPVADNPDDNSRALSLNVTDEKVPLILIDDGHDNVGASPSDTRLFVSDMTNHGYNVLFNLDDIAATDLNTETVKLLIINAYGPDQLTVTETQAVADFVAAGGSLWLNGISDYASTLPWADTAADRMNGLVSAVETRVGTSVPIRMNDDEVLDGNNNNGYPWGVLWHLFPASTATGVGVNVTQIQSWSDCSMTDGAGDALTASDLGGDGFLFVEGDLDTGTGTYGLPNRTHNDDVDGMGDAYIYPSTTPLAGAAGYDIPGTPGRLFLYGDSNDPFNIFAYTAGDGKQNELFNLEVVMWLLGEPLQKSTVAQARADAELNNTPDRLGDLVWVEGEITTGYGEFFNVLFVQDETGGIMVHAPAGDIYAADFVRGTQVRVVGNIDIYNGETEIEFFEAEQVQVLTPTTGAEPIPLPMSTYNASLEANEGWLVQITGTVTAKTGSYSIVVDDGSGPVRAFLDDYNGTFDDVAVQDIVTVVGLVSEDGDGRRIHVRNHGMHAELPDDVAILGHITKLYLPLIMRETAN